ncbi:hypothetical protein P175DRAFT_0352293 [Aspergillus ochraceoroseus IBT 24754]|uniref:Uncharacterized protein n=1 Tax=Aspergillus ochraceoroseus IBT 24754 TaxID=1392256 RepID=A0A2T5LPG5_9EURO|nr:uncharacterized protein P175DRAFT_0352293 [Aspergillus ochraceoroseus IBT 24754]PTU18171.1 hypothetical protein P175DRAFT_0352293 [Aspergillus ochraceoroseus IBT 24754]
METSNTLRPRCVIVLRIALSLVTTLYSGGRYIYCLQLVCRDAFISFLIQPCSGNCLLTRHTTVLCLVTSLCMRRYALFIVMILINFRESCICQVEVTVLVLCR